MNEKGTPSLCEITEEEVPSQCGWVPNASLSADLPCDRGERDVGSGTGVRDLSGNIDRIQQRGFVYIMYVFFSYHLFIM